MMPSLQALRRTDGATDMVEAIRDVLRASDQPLTPTQVRARLPWPLRGFSLEGIRDTLSRQVAAQVLILYPKYRSDQDRYWDRPLRQHVEQLLRGILRDRPMTRTELRRRLPAYARILADNVLDALLAKSRVFEHPGSSRRAGPRLASYPADPRPHLHVELEALFGRLERLGFTRRQLRDATLTLLQEDGAPRAGDEHVSGEDHFVGAEELLTI
jgi:hypothetical protein